MLFDIKTPYSCRLFNSMKAGVRERNWGFRQSMLSRTIVTQQGFFPQIRPQTVKITKFNWMSFFATRINLVRSTIPWSKS